MRRQQILAYFQNPLLRWALTLTWTAIAASLMLSPSGDGTTVTWVSKLFGGTETTDAIGHVIINTILAFLWCWTLSLYSGTGKTTRLVLFGGFIWCCGAESLQYFVPERGTSLLDLSANFLGVFVGLAIYRALDRYHPTLLGFVDRR
ncbi:VanZ family protein [Aggregatilinea lenta]|uniref:VanZ family protein n=1 Tax=Aggregatilinea lenta TaxID=913108 RepID=UPI000E5BFDDA|nr:VanZ family protein [Aggregatilinea lenta]